MRTVLLRDPYYVPEERDMNFTLTYEGLLLGASRSDTRAQHKHEIRKKLQPQLRHLWGNTSHLVYRKKFPALEAGWGATEIPGNFTEEEKHHGVMWSEYMARQFTRLGYRFVPLVVEELTLSCRLEILFLRWDRPGSIIRSGDIDNRLKTLFDALRMPASLAELGGYQTPGPEEDPFYCLLQDDKLISHIAVETDVLHEPVSQQYDTNDARLIIRVTIRPTHVNMLTSDFL